MKNKFEFNKESTTEVLMNSDPLSHIETWKAMQNEIEVFQTIKKIVLDAFQSVMPSMPHQLRLVFQEKIDRLKETDHLFELDDLYAFFVQAKIVSSSMLSDLDNNNIKDYAAPFTVIKGLDSLIRFHERYEKENINILELGTLMVGGLYGLREKMLQTDWRSGWQ